MSLVINTNIMSINGQRMLGVNTTLLAKTMEKLASGYRINKAGDDAAGLQISESLRSKIRGTQKAVDNVQDGVNVLNVMDGSLNQITENIQRMRELTVQGANDTLATAQRSAIKVELDQLSADITRIAQSTEFNGVNLFTSTNANFRVQVGPNNSTATNSLNLATVTGTNIFSSMAAGDLTLSTTDLSVSTSLSALDTLSNLDAALTTLNTRRASLGALVNRLEGTANNLSINAENMAAAESRIRNVDVARETANLTRYQILQQASVSILTQAGKNPSLALNLLNAN